MKATSIYMSMPVNCQVCGAATNGRGGKGLCVRCYTRHRRNLKPTVAPLKRAPGTWRNVQAHLDLNVYEALVAAAKAWGQSVPVWIQDAIEQRLNRAKRVHAQAAGSAAADVG